MFQTINPSENIKTAQQNFQIGKIMFRSALAPNHCACIVGSKGIACRKRNHHDYLVVTGHHIVFYNFIYYVAYHWEILKL